MKVPGRLRARAAICSVSTGVLAVDEIEFSPRLPDCKIDAIHGLPTGTMNKIGVHFDKDVFGSDGRGFHATWSDADEAGSFEASVMGHDIAIVFCSARFAVWLENQGPQAMTDFALNRIADVFGNDIRKSVSRAITTAWHGDPWTRGSYSCALPGHGKQRVEPHIVDSREHRFLPPDAPMVIESFAAHLISTAPNGQTS